MNLRDKATDLLKAIEQVNNQADRITIITMYLDSTYEHGRAQGFAEGYSGHDEGDKGLDGLGW